MGQLGTSASLQVTQEILFEDLFARGVVIGARPAPGVVMCDEHDLLVAVARHGAQVIPARRAHRPFREPLPLDVRPAGKLSFDTRDKLLELALVVLDSLFEGESLAGAADVLEDFGDALVDWLVPGVDLMEQPRR